MLPLLPCAVGLIALSAAEMLPAQVVDNRPVYYVMLKSLEDSFEAYTTSLASDLDARASALKTRYDAERLAITQAYEQLQADRAARESEFNSEREALSERIAAITEQMTLRTGRIKEERRIQQHYSPRYAKDPRISVLKERIAAQLAAIDGVRSSYVAQSKATEEARATLTRRIEEYVSNGDPLALEIRSLNEDLQKFAEKQRSKLKKAADAYAVDYAIYDKWLQSERAVIEELKAALNRIQETDREQRARHRQTEILLRGVIDEYNALVEVHNKAAADDPDRDRRAAAFATLEARIAELQSALSQAREAVVRANEEIEKRNQALTEHYARFASAKRSRDAALAADLAEINATRLTAEAAIEARRQQAEAQIKSLEAHISGELRDARKNLEELNARMINAFGPDHEGLDAALTRVIDMNDDSLLYTEDGAPRFDLSRPMAAEVYRAVEQLEADRRAMDARIAVIDKAEGSAPVNAGPAPPESASLEQALAAASAERQELLEAYAASARESQARSNQLEERLRAIDERYSQDRELLAELYSARADLTRSEMQTVQQVLVAAVKGAPSQASESGEYARFLEALRNAAGQMNPPPGPSLLAPHALLDALASQVPAVSSSPDARTWAPFTTREISASRKLSGADKRALTAAWLERLRRQPEFADMVRRLDTSDAVANAGQALASLFVAGVMEHAELVEQRLDDGAVGIQVTILGRDYQLDVDGSLVPLPEN